MMMANIKKLLGARIKELRKKRGLTQEKMAELIEISPPSVSKIESGIYHPTEENIEKIANVLDVQVYELYKFDSNLSSEKIKKNIYTLLDKATKEQLDLLLKITRDIIN